MGGSGRGVSPSPATAAASPTTCTHRPLSSSAGIPVFPGTGVASRPSVGMPHLSIMQPLLATEDRSYSHECRRVPVGAVVYITHEGICTDIRLNYGLSGVRCRAMKTSPVPTPPILVAMAVARAVATAGGRLRGRPRAAAAAARRAWRPAAPCRYCTNPSHAFKKPLSKPCLHMCTLSGRPKHDHIQEAPAASQVCTCAHLSGHSISGASGASGKSWASCCAPGLRLRRASS